MLPIRLVAIALPVLLLAACSGGDKPASGQPSAGDAQSSAPVAAPAADKALAPLFGTWGLDPANCGDQVLKISQTTFEGPGSSCRQSYNRRRVFRAK